MNTLLQLGVLFTVLGEIQGRKKLQKMVHILQGFGVPFNVRFGYHHYGPYSEELQDSIQACLHDKLLNETTIPGQFPTSKFCPQPRFADLLEKTGTEKGQPWVNFAQELNRKTPRELEAISTLLYLENEEATGYLEEPLEVAFIGRKPQLENLLQPALEYIGEARLKYGDLALA